MELSEIIRRILEVAEKLLPALSGTPAAAVVNAGKALLDLITDIREVADEDDAAALQRKRDELEPLVMAHLGRTIDSLD